MAKRGRAISIDRLVKEVSQLDAQRKALVARIRQAVESTLNSVETSIQLAGEGTGFAAGVRGPRKPGRPAGSTNAAPARKRRKMSAKARKAISDAQKKRWAAQKAAAR